MVLVIDDEPSVRMSAKRILERYGYQILIAEDGQVGLDMFRENAAQIVAILLDMAMPVMSGEETFRKIRAIRSDACVVLSSGLQRGRNDSTLLAPPESLPLSKSLLQQRAWPASSNERLRTQSSRLYCFFLCSPAL